MVCEGNSASHTVAKKKPALNFELLLCGHVAEKLACQLNISSPMLKYYEPITLQSVTNIS